MRSVGIELAMAHGIRNGQIGVLVLTVSSRTSLLLLVELVVEEQVLVILCEPALVGVGGTVVGCAGQLGGHGAAVNVDNGEGILVVVEANLAALEITLGSVVDDALSVVGVAVVGNTAGVLGTGRVGDVNHPQTGAALEAVLGADGGNEVRLLVGDNVVAAAKLGKVRRQVVADAEGLGALRVDLEQLLEVKDLQAVVGGLGANVGKVANDLDVAPDGLNRLGGQAANVRQAAVLADLDKGGAVRLTEEGKLASRARGPTPNVVALARAAADVLVAEEALEVDILALVLAGLAVGAGRGARLLVPVEVEDAVGALLLALALLAVLNDRHGQRVGSAAGLQGLGVVGRGLDLLGNGPGGEGTEEERSKGLHDDCWEDQKEF